MKRIVIIQANGQQRYFYCGASDQATSEAIAANLMKGETVERIEDIQGPDLNFSSRSSSSKPGKPKEKYPRSWSGGVKTKYSDPCNDIPDECAFDFFQSIRFMKRP